MSAGLSTGVFSDKRLDRRWEQIFGPLVSRKRVVLHKRMAGYAALTGAYRFMNHQQISDEVIRDRLTSCWSAQGKSILCLQDTSEANFCGHSRTLKVNDRHLGPVGNQDQVGFFMHPSLCLDMANGFRLYGCVFI